MKLTNRYPNERSVFDAVPMSKVWDFKKKKMSKKAISATIDEELIKWINKRLEDKTRYRNKSHLIEIALELLKEEEKE